MHINVERVPHNGHLLLSTIVNGYRFKRTYIDYSLKEAKELFREAVKQEKQEK